MKILQYLSFAAVGSLLMAADCSNKDSEFYNDVFVHTTDNIVVIEQLATFNLGSEYVINATFSKYINEAYQATILDVYKTSVAQSFSFSFLIEKENASGDWELITPTLNTFDGSAEPGDFVFAHSKYDGNSQYNFKTAVQLNDAGNFRLSFGYDGLPSKTVILRSDSSNSNLFVNLYSLCAQLDSSGYYYYTVNE
jgi:hypothetical protein